MDRNVLGNGYNRRNAGICRFHNRIAASGTRNEDNRCPDIMLVNCVCYRVVHRNTVNFLAALARSHTCRNTGAADSLCVLVHQIDVESALGTGCSLDQNLRLFSCVNHLHTSTAARIASSMVGSIK